MVFRAEHGHVVVDVADREVGTDAVNAHGFEQ